jgi:hypothetical protein
VLDLIRGAFVLHTRGYVRVCVCACVRVCACACVRGCVGMCVQLLGMLLVAVDGLASLSSERGGRGSAGSALLMPCSALNQQ